MKAVEEHFPVSLFGDSKSTSVSCLVYEQTSTFFWFNLKHEGCLHMQTWPLDKASRTPRTSSLSSIHFEMLLKNFKGFSSRMGIAVSHHLIFSFEV